MSNNVLLAAIFLALFATCQTPPDSVDRGQLVWYDEFNYEGGPDSALWVYHEGDGCPTLCGWGNNELQYYTSREKNIRVEDGKLVIEAHQENLGTREYTSAKIQSRKGSIPRYAYIEVRARLPWGRGTWPAVWMLPDSALYGGWPRSGEIDIMEHVGFDPGVVHGTVHTEAFNHMRGTQVGKQRKVPDAGEAFHVYAVDWTAQRIVFLIDDVEYHVFENNGSGTDAWPFDHPFHIILNLAVGGNWGGQQGVDPSVWPQRFEIDYVRVYSPRGEQSTETP